LCYNSLYRPTIGYFQHFGTSITNAYSTHFVKSSGLDAKAKFHYDMNYMNYTIFRGLPWM